MSIKKLSFMLLSALSLAALLNGCGSSSKEAEIAAPGGVARVGEGQCITCHSATADNPTNRNIVGEFFVSAHNADDLGCQGCHGGGAKHNGAGPIPFPNPLLAYTENGVTNSSRCIVCHTKDGFAPTFQNLSSLFRQAKADGFQKNNCAHCHTSSDSGSLHAAQVPADTKGCVDCHDVAAPQHGPGLVGDNNGVRAIVGEFAKTSHHVTGRDLNNTDCAVCHLEGKMDSDSNSIKIDKDFHMKDGNTYLRNGNKTLVGNQTKAVGAGYPWNPATPDHDLMDQFCFSCHNAAGAPTAVEALVGVTGYTGTALNPFGDTISNGYDQVFRPAVVGVYEQFATSNSSHHAVRGQKYTSKNLTAAQFTNISTANVNFFNGVTAAPIKGLRNTPDVFNPTTGVVTTTGVKMGTMFETGKFVATYTTLNNVVVADDSVIHCGDCHTVGQFKPGSAKKADGTATTVAIGAHGSNNEYMLRNSKSDDAFSRDALVCFLCHKENLYSVPKQTEVNQSTQIDGVVAHNSVNNSFADCNGNNENSAGMTGRARLVPEERAMDDATFQADVAAGIYQPTGGGNIFGIKCANCHNASDNKAFGGIHGNAGNASYTTYSGAKTVAGVVSAVSRKPYRFLPGLGNFRYNGGDSADQWTVRTISQANKQGCYTLNGASTVTRGVARVANPAPTKATASGANVSAAAIANDNGLLGSWGACTDHAGTSVFGGRATTRTLLRPLTY